MRHFPDFSLFRVFAFFCVTISLIATTAYARPRDLQAVSSSPRLDISPPNYLSHSTEALAVTPQHQKRGPVTYYNNLAPWKVALTATAFFWNAANQVAIPAPDIAALWATVAADAATAIASNTPSGLLYEWGQGAIQVHFALRLGAGGSATIPWSLVAKVATEFQARALGGNSGAFRGQVNGPLGTNGVGQSPYVEVALTFGGKVVMDGINWAIF